MFYKKKSVAFVLAVAFTLGVSGCAGASDYWPKTETVEAGGSAISIVTRTAEKIGDGSEGAIIKGLTSLTGNVALGTVCVCVNNGVSGAQVINNTLLRDDVTLDRSERDARSVGRAGSYVGGVAGGAAVAYTAAAGSAAGITGALATVGSAVGGGMAAGAAVVLIGPAVIAAATGGVVYGTVKLVSWLWD